MMAGFMRAMSAGLCAASAAVAAKYAFSPDEGERLCALFLFNTLGMATDYVPEVSLILRVVCFLLTLGLNGLMWTMYVKSMQVIGTVRATLTNTASNLLFTALFGWLLFNEAHSVQWFCGASLIVTGILLMQHGSKQTDEKDGEDREHTGDKKDR